MSKRTDMDLRNVPEMPAMELQKYLSQLKNTDKVDIHKNQRSALTDVGNAQGIPKDDGFDGVGKGAVKKLATGLKKPIVATTTTTITTTTTTTAIPKATTITDKLKNCVTNPIKESKLIVNLKNVKPRVDTRWNKNEVRKYVKPESNKNVKSSKTSLPVPTHMKTSKQPTNLGGAGYVKVINVGDKKIVNLKLTNGKISDDPKIITQQEYEQKQRAEKSQKTDNENKEFVKYYSKYKIVPPEICNIDEGDNYNMFLVSEYANDIFSYLRELENKYPIDMDYLKNQIEITPRMRTILHSWLNEVSAQFHLLLETFQMAVAIVDRYLQKVQTTKKEQLQLVGITGIFIASKYEELFPVEAQDLSHTTDCTYDVNDILIMEQNILRALEFNLGRPTPIQFLRRFSNAADATTIHHQTAKYLLELAALEYTLAHIKPSEIAAAALFFSIILHDNNTFVDIFDGIDVLWTPTLRFYSKYSSTELMPTVLKLAKIAYNVSNSKFKAVFDRYKHEKYSSVSLKVESMKPTVEKFINKFNVQ